MIAIAAAAASLVAGCSSLGPVSPGAGPRGLDYLNDDLGSMALAFDVPVTLEPAPAGSTLSFAVSVPGAGERQVSAVLVRGDASDVMEVLPPPAENRTYYVFALAAEDGGRLREAQDWARAQALQGKAPNTPVISIAPRFCQTARVDAARTMVSVRLVLPQRGLSTALIEGQSVAALLAAGGGGTLPDCAGHSG
jgi:hypothetical protein